jgi:hypothetical protein
MYWDLKLSVVWVIMLHSAEFEVGEDGMLGHEKPLGVSYMGSITETWNLGWDYIP